MRSTALRRFALGLAVVGGAACVPDLGSDDSTIASTRVLAVRSDPAEARPGTKATYSALVAGPDGTVDAPAIRWSFCNAPKPLTDDNVVSDACLDSSSLVAAGVGPTIDAGTPANGCSVFGPETPAGGFRPRDPDITGGYYQPLRADLAGAPQTFDLVRIQCDLANAPAAIVAQFTATYKANLNPLLAPLVATLNGAPVPFDAIPARARVVFTARWTSADAESYVYFDPDSQSLTTKRESMRVAWYATAGALDSESTGRADSDPPPRPTTPGWRLPHRAPFTCGPSCATAAAASLSALSTFRSPGRASEGLGVSRRRSPSAPPPSRHGGRV